MAISTVYMSLLHITYTAHIVYIASLFDIFHARFNISVNGAGIVMLMHVDAMPSTATKMMLWVRYAVHSLVHRQYVIGKQTRTHIYTTIIETHIPNCILDYGSHI